MKKNLMMLVLAGALALGSTGVVFAEEAETEEIMSVTMEMMDAELYEGTWVSFAGGFDLYLPTDWNVMEVTEEQAADGIIFLTAAPDDSGLTVVVMANQMEADTALEDIGADLTEAYGPVDYMYINEIPVVAFDTETTTGVAFIDEADVMYNIQMAPISEEDLDPILTNIFFSLSPTITEETEAAE